MPKITSKKQVLGAEIVPVRAENILFRENADQTVAIMKLDEDDYFFVLNGVAAEVWKMFDGKKNVTKICDDITRRFDVSANVVMKDIKGLLKQLKSKHLIVY